MHLGVRVSDKHLTRAPSCAWSRLTGGSGFSVQSHGGTADFWGSMGVGEGGGNSQVGRGGACLSITTVRFQVLGELWVLEKVVGVLRWLQKGVRWE